MGESSCNSTPEITRGEQQLITFSFLKLWLSYSLYNDQDAFILFNDALDSSTEVLFSQNCNLTGFQDYVTNDRIKIFPNPVLNKLDFTLSEQEKGGLLNIYNAIGESVYCNNINEIHSEINVSYLNKGAYVMVYIKDEFLYSKHFVKVE